MEENYVELLRKAFINTERFSFKNKPLISTSSTISVQELKDIETYIFEHIYPHLYAMHPTYWGGSCQFLASHLFAILTTLNHKVDIVIGEVNINGTLEFDTTLDALERDYHAQHVSNEAQSLHAWVSLGGDTIIDAGLPDRMIKHYKFPDQRMPPVIVGRAAEIALKFKAKYQPLIVGTDYFAKTNPPDPRDIIKIYSTP